jgi:bifunctional UDP-N-acetylglucosamine pyrophosphorylase/glucosamine-1-phosphate N-acetyltransferase
MEINSCAEYAAADRPLRLRKAQELMASGVTILDPERTYIDPEVRIAPDTEILPGTHLRGRTVIGAGCVIGPDCFIEDSTVEDGSLIRYSVVESSRVRSGSRVGPYAHLRPGADVGPNVRIGNFVEVKASRMKRGAKAGHLTYIGDSEVGENVNIGAGTITCNYDGKEKHRTTIEDRAFIGSNTSLVAPVTIGEGAVIGAGSTVTQDVPPGALALGRARQVNKERKEEKEAREE